MMTLFLLGSAAMLSPVPVQPVPVASPSREANGSAGTVGPLAEMETRLDGLGRCIAEAMLTSKSLIAVELVEHAYSACETQTTEVGKWFGDNNAPRTFSVIMVGLRARSEKLAKDMEARARADGVPLRW